MDRNKLSVETVGEVSSKHDSSLIIRKGRLKIAILKSSSRWTSDQGSASSLPNCKLHLIDKDLFPPIKIVLVSPFSSPEQSLSLAFIVQERLLASDMNIKVYLPKYFTHSPFCHIQVEVGCDVIERGMRILLIDLR